MKFSVFVKKLSNPRVRWRLKVGLSVWALVITMSMISKLAYDIGYFKAQSQVNDKIAALPAAQAELSIATAQRIVSGALKEDVNNPKTIVRRVVENDKDLSIVIIETNKKKRIGWIINMHLFFTGSLYSDNGYNLTESMERHYRLN